METQLQPGPPAKQHKLSFRLNKKQLLAATLLLILVAGSATAGWYVRGSKINDLNQQISSLNKHISDLQTQPTKPVSVSDPTASWNTYVSTGGPYNLRYNPNWKIATGADAGCVDPTDATLFLAPTDKALGKCGTEFAGQMHVFVVDGDQRTNSGPDSLNFKDITSADVTVDGIAGQRKTGVAIGNEFLTADSYQVTYIFYTKNKTYIIGYEQDPSGALAKDVLSDFDLMVQNSLKFK